MAKFLYIGKITGLDTYQFGNIDVMVGVYTSESQAISAAKEYLDLKMRIQKRNNKQTGSTDGVKWYKYVRAEKIPFNPKYDEKTGKLI